MIKLKDMKMNFSVTKNGVPLDSNLYTWDEETKTFSSNENNLVLDFTGMDYITFKTGSDCTFRTGSYCTFDTLSHCTFTTRSDCNFDTGHDCTFDTGSRCTFDTLSYCTFTTGSDCNFDTGHDCTFDTEYNCTFTTGSNCVVIRRDIFEVIKLEKENNHIELKEK